jgi:hypothetical protein
LQQIDQLLLASAYIIRHGINSNNNLCYRIYSWIERKYSKDERILSIVWAIVNHSFAFWTQRSLAFIDLPVSDTWRRPSCSREIACWMRAGAGALAVKAKVRAPAAGKMFCRLRGLACKLARRSDDIIDV